MHSKTKLKRFDFRDGIHLYSFFYDDTEYLIDHMCCMQYKGVNIFTDKELIKMAKHLGSKDRTKE